MTTVMLYGVLGRLFGRVHRLHVASPAEAVRALCTNYPDMKAWLYKNEDHAFRVLVGDNAISEEKLSDPAGKKIRIVPVVSGAGDSKGLFNIILGGALIAFSFGAFGAGLAGTELFTLGSTTYTLGSIAGNIGFSLALGGVAQLMAPTPTVMESAQVANNKPSFAFSGVINNVSQGAAVPIGYGRYRIGSVVISTSLAVEQLTS